MKQIRLPRDLPEKYIQPLERFTGHNKIYGHKISTNLVRKIGIGRNPIPTYVLDSVTKDGTVFIACHKSFTLFLLASSG